MDITQIILLSIAGLIILFVVINSMIRFFNHRSVSTNNVDTDDFDEENIVNIQVNEPEAVEEILETELQSNPKPTHRTTHTEPAKRNIMMISVHARPNTFFSGYNFLQTMGSVGLVYGEHKIFHYDVKTDIGMQRLFSVAQLNNPGTFDIDHIENIRCKGLLLFIDLRACRKPVLALDCMLETAYQLAEDLDGIMFEEYNIAWQDDTPRALSQKLESYYKNRTSVFDETVD